MPHLLRDSPLTVLSVSPRSTSDEALDHGNAEYAELLSTPSVPPRFRVDLFHCLDLEGMSAYAIDGVGGKGNQPPADRMRMASAMESSVMGRALVSI
jgi:hypothetical protein